MRKIPIGLIAGLLGAASFAAPAHATEPLDDPVWLCHPSQLDNLCGQDAAGNAVDATLTARYPDGYATDLGATVVHSDQSTSGEPLPPPSDPEVDCFYAYPTVNLLSNPLLLIGDNPPSVRNSEAAVTFTQVGRLASHCRMFVPLYRQEPLTSYLLSVISPPDFETGYQDIKQAFQHYWDTDNFDPVTGQRRGVVLLGHSQGGFALQRLLQEEFDGNAARTDQLVAAYVLGADVEVPVDDVAGGGSDPVSTFQHLPACVRASTDEPIPTGCIVAYNSADLDPEEADEASFGHSPDADHRVLCVNPAAILAGAAPETVQPLRPYLPTRQLVRGNVLNPRGALALTLGFNPTTYPTGFAAYTDLATGSCQQMETSTGRMDWLQVDGLEDIRDSSEQLGLHVLDFNVDSGGLVDLVEAQAVEWLAAQ